MLAACAGTVARAPAQFAVPPPAPVVRILTGPELDQMLGPIALYPDPLLSQILPAATLPSEIVLADRYVNGGGDPNFIEQQPWDPSVQAVAHYPSLIKWLDDNIAWTTAVGQAFLNQQQDVMDSVQRLRAQAQALGNLQSTPQESVVVDNGYIEILPTNPNLIYLPVYQPDVVYVQRAYGAPFVSFGVGLSIGAWLNHDWDWHNHHIIVWGHDHPRPPDWWSHRPGERPRVDWDRARVWQPHTHPALPSRHVDRGWNPGPARSTVTTIGAQPRLPEHYQAPAPRRAEPVITSHPAEAPRSRPANGALLGIQSSRETHEFSHRGQESRQVVAPHPAGPPAHAEAPGHGGKR